jgi:proteasome lid subunit RPN8/RPN11
MKHAADSLAIPLYVKTNEEMPWPGEESVFYVLSGCGLFLCRNHPYFRSSVPARNWPKDLALHDRSLSLHLPKVPRRQLELIVGFFSQVADSCGGEAAAFLLWHEERRRMRFWVPSQVTTVRHRDGRQTPISLRYEMETPVDAGWTVLGDVHSHVDGAAYCSSIDREDEAYRPGLHIVVGRIGWEPPEFHCEFAVDGSRFEVADEEVLEGYVRRRSRIPQGWMRKVRVVRRTGYGW